MLNVAYYLTKTEGLKGQLVSEKIDNEMIQNNLNSIKSKLKTLDSSQGLGLCSPFLNSLPPKFKRSHASRSFA
jgi:hypothetical protein